MLASQRVASDYYPYNAAIYACIHDFFTFCSWRVEFYPKHFVGIPKVFDALSE